MLQRGLSTLKQCQNMIRTTLSTYQRERVENKSKPIIPKPNTNVFCAYTQMMVLGIHFLITHFGSNSNIDFNFSDLGISKRIRSAYYAQHWTLPNLKVSSSYSNV